GEAVYEAIWRGETQRLERSQVRTDGTRIWCSISGRAVQPGDPSQGSVWLWEDITQEREAEQRVQRALAEQELILDNATVGIAFVRQRSIQRCNRFLEEMVGAGPGELVGQSSAVLFADEPQWQEAGRPAATRNRTYQRCNPRFAQMFGYAAADLIGKTSNVIFPTKRNFDQAAEWYGKLATGQAFSTEHRFKRKDGSLFWCKVVAKAIDPQRLD